jgi:hypothetical protein
MGSTRSGRRLVARVAACCLACWLLSTADASAQSLAVTWDASPDATVSGYLVFVGTVSGDYSERYDAGPTHSFAYESAAPGSTYYFAVASYTANRIVGPLSAEVSASVPGTGTSEESGATPIRPRASARASEVALIDTIDIPRRLCPATPGNCYDVTSVESATGRVTSLAAANDGRLFAIEDGLRVRIAEGSVWRQSPALIATPNIRLGDVILAPDFDATGFVFVSQIVTSGDGSHDMRIVRYREVANTLGEAAVMVSGLRVAEGGAPFTLGGGGRIYVSVPAAGGDAYAGKLLRFERDGRVARDNPGLSPVFADAYQQPEGLVWDSRRVGIWLTGRDGKAGGVLAQISNPYDGAGDGPSSAEVPLSFIPTAIAMVPSGDVRPSSFVLTSADFLHLYAHGQETAQAYDLRPVGRIEAAAGGGNGAIFLSVTDRNGRSLVLQLRQP